MIHVLVDQGKNTKNVVVKTKIIIELAFSQFFFYSNIMKSTKNTLTNIYMLDNI
jgi:hypothetical protein